MKRFLKFYNILQNSDKPHLKYLMKLQESDYRSVFGKNISNICTEAGADNISQVLASDIVYHPVPEEEIWRVSLILELLEMKAGRTEAFLSTKEVEKLIELVASD